MDETVLEIREYIEEGYKPLVDYADWRVAILNYIDELRPDQNTRMERHMETDEVFVLMRGRTVLFMGGNSPQVEVITPQVMEPGKLYNVKKGAWHNILMTRDASILLVENRNTDDDNSEYFYLTPEMHNQVMEIAKTNQID
jgi:ureidoglycolate hydrolase